MDRLVSRLILGLGGAENVVDIEPCIQRIRVEVRDPAAVDETLLRQPEVLAVVRSGEVVQIVAGRISDDLADKISHATGVPLHTVANNAPSTP
ncbi:MAG: PTS transporter subunit EIIB [Actinomycetaceae bacterium]|nr:PTS transporter subunit EIIB [Actinomycetaceae bacterium]